MLCLCLFKVCHSSQLRLTVGCFSFTTTQISSLCEVPYLVLARATYCKLSNGGGSQLLTIDETLAAVYVLSVASHRLHLNEGLPMHAWDGLRACTCTSR